MTFNFPGEHQRQHPRDDQLKNRHYWIRFDYSIGRDAVNTNMISNFILAYNWYLLLKISDSRCSNLNLGVLVGGQEKYDKNEQDRMDSNINEIQAQET